MATENIDAYAKCPYYHKTRRRNTQRLEIVCEGIIDGTKLTSQWENEKYLYEHLKKCCCNQYNKCQIAEIINRKYE